MIESIRYMSIYDAYKIIKNLSEDLKESTLLISIREPTVDLNNDTFPYDNLYKKNLLILQFDDVSESEIRNIESKLSPNFYKLFDDLMASDIVNFIDSTYSNPVNCNLIIHCHAGISRSASIYMILCKVLELPYNENYIMHNKHVYNKLYKMIYGFDLYGYK